MTYRQVVKPVLRPHILLTRLYDVHWKRLCVSAEGVVVVVALV